MYVVPILHNRLPLSASELPLPVGYLDHNLIHGFGPIRIHYLNGILISSAVFAGLMIVTD